MGPAMEIKQLHGKELEPWIDALGALRIAVFHEYPYLYDGTIEDERDYLKVYTRDPESLVVLVLNDEGVLVGATTCMPLTKEAPAFRKPFEEAGISVGEVLYFGESILLPEYRGKGLGKTFFDLREAHARKLGLKTTAFCAVDRADDHPAKPNDYRPLDGFWRARGYQKRPGMRAVFSWKENGATEETANTLTFWTRTCEV